MRLLRIYPISALSAVLGLLAVTATVQANPIAPPIWNAGGEDPTFVYYIVLVNLPVDLFLLAAALLVTAWVIGVRMGDVSPDFPIFASLIVAGAGVVALLGAAIDYIFAYSWNPWSGYELVYDPLMWLLGALLIMGSVFLSYVVLVRIRPRVAIIPSAIVALVSPLTWYGADTLFNSMFLLLPLLGGSVAIILVFAGLRMWHKRNFPNARRV